VQGKYEKLCETIRPYKKVAVCLSGGSDSALVAVAAVDALGNQNVVGITANTAFLTGEDLQVSSELCQTLQIKHLTPRAFLLTDKNIVQNGGDRCYFCRKDIAQVIRKEASGHDISVLLDGGVCPPEVEGGLLPGERAFLEAEIKSPLKEAGILKEEIFDLLKQRGMKRFIRPGDACLASRIARGEPITVKKLRWIRAAENFIRQLGFEVVCVRVKDGNARIEVALEKVPELLEIQEEVLSELRGMGYNQVEIALEGYKRIACNL